MSFIYNNRVWREMNNIPVINYAEHKIRYRPHRGLLEESMKGYKEFDTVEDMIAYVVESWSGFIDADDIVIGEVIGTDDRIGWKAYRHVLTKRCGDEIYDTPQCIGMCDLGDG